MATTLVNVIPEVFACYSKVCAPPPAGRGGSSKRVGSIRHQIRNNPVAGPDASPVERKAAYVKEFLANRRNTTVIRDGKMAITVGGGKKPTFYTRPNTSTKWMVDKATTKISHDRIAKILREATAGS